MYSGELGGQDKENQSSNSRNLHPTEGGVNMISLSWLMQRLNVRKEGLPNFIMFEAILYLILYPNLYNIAGPVSVHRQV